MNRILIALVLCLQLTSVRAQPDKQKIAWWQDARFGMFIHWGVYSAEGRGEWIMYQEHIPFKEYKNLAEKFHPRSYDPAQWVQIARDAGMKYVVLTTRHHDGYCLYDSKVSDFTSVKVGPGKDLVAEFATACHKAGMKMGFYYSLTDWHLPGVLPQGYPKSKEIIQPLAKQAHEQVRELLSNYGKVDILWFDGMTPGDTTDWRSSELIQMARQLQPGILINDRAGTGGDFLTPENVVTAHDQPWEACYTMNRSWGYAPFDNNYKPVAELIRLLSSCVSQGGNFLLNVSPDENGTIPAQQIASLREIGKWIKIHGAAIYHAAPSPIVVNNLGFQCRVGDKVYLFVQRWPGTVLPFAWCGSAVESARILTTGQSLQIEQNGDRVWLRGLPATPPDPYMNVVELTFKGAPKASDPAYR
jgi:alpha-L-fucosidase